MRIRLLSGLLIFSSVTLPTIALAKPACDELAGAVVFYDMLYGVVGGAVLGGLYIAATEKSEKAGPNIASAALGGAILGTGAGALELALRECHPAAVEKNSTRENQPTPKLAVSRDAGGNYLLGANFSF